MLHGYINLANTDKVIFTFTHKCTRADKRIIPIHNKIFSLFIGSSQVRKWPRGVFSFITVMGRPKVSSICSKMSPHSNLAPTRRFVIKIGNSFGEFGNQFQRAERRRRRCWWGSIILSSITERTNGVPTKMASDNMGGYLKMAENCAWWRYIGIHLHTHTDESYTNTQGHTYIHA